MSLRIGHGLDAHRLVDGRPLMLGGIRVEHERGLAGHSDGDAVAHALWDALLGAAGLGDRAAHCPSSDDRWGGAPGAEFLGAEPTKLRARGWRVVGARVVAGPQEPR